MSKNISEEKVLGQVIKSYRLQADKTQEVLALDAGLDRTYISMLERGEASPTLKTLRALAKSLNIPLEILIREFESRLS